MTPSTHVPAGRAVPAAARAGAVPGHARRGAVARILESLAADRERRAAQVVADTLPDAPRGPSPR